MWERLAEWDRDTFVYLNNLGIEDYDSFWLAITQPQHWIPLYIIFLALFFVAFSWRKALMAVSFTFLTAIGINLFTELVKNYVARLRPNNEPLLTDLIRVLQEPHNFSFFSGHAASSFAITTFVVLVQRKRFKWAYLFYLWPLLFTSSRIFVGVHYPSDIITGMLVGILFGFLFYFLFSKVIVLLEKRFADKTI